MVAYGFQSIFVAQIEARTKRQTIGRSRRRHARPGERVQLYEGMRTKRCRKIIPDPVCVSGHIVAIGADEPLEFRLCGACMYAPGWFRIPEVRGVIDPDHVGREAFEADA